MICCVRAEIDGSACWAGRAPAGVLGVAERWLLGWAEKAEAAVRGGSESKGEKRGRLGGEGAGRVLVVRAGIAERTRSESVATWAERAETCASVRARRARRARYASEDSNSGGVGDIAGGPMAGGGVGGMERREYVKNCGMTEAIAPPRHFQAPRRHGIWTEPQRPHIYPTNNVKPDAPCLCR